MYVCASPPISIRGPITAAATTSVGAHINIGNSWEDSPISRPEGSAIERSRREGGRDLARERSCSNQGLHSAKLLLIKQRML